MSAVCDLPGWALLQPVSSGGETAPSPLPFAIAALSRLAPRGGCGVCGPGVQHAGSGGASGVPLCLSFPPRSLTRLLCVPAVPRLQRGGVLPSSSEKQVRDHGFRQLAAGGPAKPASVTALTLEEYLNTSVKALPICLRFQRNYSVYGKRERARESESTHARERDCRPFRSMFTLNKAASVCESPWC